MKRLFRDRRAAASHGRPAVRRRGRCDTSPQQCRAETSISAPTSSCSGPAGPLSMGAACSSGTWSTRVLVKIIQGRDAPPAVKLVLPERPASSSFGCPIPTRAAACRRRWRSVAPRDMVLRLYFRSEPSSAPGSPRSLALKGPARSGIGAMLHAGGRRSRSNWSASGGHAPHRAPTTSTRRFAALFTVAAAAVGGGTRPGQRHDHPPTPAPCSRPQGTGRGLELQPTQGPDPAQAPDPRPRKRLSPRKRRSRASAAARASAQPAQALSRASA